MKYKLIVTLLVFYLFVPVVNGQQVTLETEGECREYDVTVLAEDFEPGMYDVKVEVYSDGERVGEIYDPIEGWQSTMYYLEGAIQVEETNNRTTGNATVEVMTEIRDNITMFARLRHGDETWDSEDKEIVQDCPDLEPVEPTIFFAVALLALILISLGVLIYTRT